MMDEWIFRYSLSFLLLSSSASQTWGIGDTHLCSSPLGMENGGIPNSALSASSYYVKNVGPDTARLNQDSQGGAWCPKEPISIGVREWLQISLNGTHLLSAVQLQGRYSHGLGQEYTEEFQLEYWRSDFTHWRKYYRFDGKSVFPGNTDTNSVTTQKLRPPLFAEKVRFVPYSAHRRVVCLRVELLGCRESSGVMQYEIPQGDTFSEGVTLFDETYDGEGSRWLRNADQIIPVNDQGQSESDDERDSESSGESTTTTSTESPILEDKPRQYLKNGVGLLTDKILGGSAFTMDIAYGLGNGWVGWRKRAGEHHIELNFQFDTLRQFEYLTLFCNNHPGKGVHFFQRAVVFFSVGGKQWGKQQVISYTPPTITLDIGREQTRNISVPLEEKMGRWVKVQLYFRSNWLLLGEVYFHSKAYSGNWTEEVEEEEMAGIPDFASDSQAPLEIGDLNSSMVETVVGVVTGLILLSGLIGGVVICLRKQGKSLPSLRLRLNSGTGDRTSGTTFHFPWRHSWNSVPTHIVAQSNPPGEGVKDILLTLTPQMTNNQQQPDASGGTILPKVHNNLRPPPYETVAAKNNLTAAAAGKLQAGTDSSTSGCYSNNASSTSSNNDPKTSMTLRSNQLAEEYETLQNGVRPRKGKVAYNCWNLSYSGGGRPPRRERGHSITDLSLRQLRLIENLGSCMFGQVHLYEAEEPVEFDVNNCRLISKTVKSFSEVRLLGALDHEHILEMVCLCTELKKPILCLYPAPECGDLCSFLSRLTNTPSLSWLLTVAAQIAGGMNYLESLSLVHKDLAARNCLVEREGNIKIADLAMSCEQYRDDYCATGEGLKPLRWWSWDSILSGEFTLQSSVWSFGVTLWEILTLCRQKPLHLLSDMQIPALAEKYGEIGEERESNLQPKIWLPKPLLSPPEIFELMLQCWKMKGSERPTFLNISAFLEQKCAHSAPIYQSIN